MWFRRASGLGLSKHRGDLAWIVALENTSHARLNFFNLWAFRDSSEDAKGGWRKEGGKPHEGHPSQKGVLDILRLVRFPHPSGLNALFFL